MHKAEYCYYTRYERNISRTLSTSVKETQTLPTQGNPICVKLALKSDKDSYNSGRTCIHCVGINDLNQWSSCLQLLNDVIKSHTQSKKHREANSGFCGWQTNILPPEPHPQPKCFFILEFLLNSTKQETETNYILPFYKYLYPPQIHVEILTFKVKNRYKSYYFYSLAPYTEN